MGFGHCVVTGAAVWAIVIGSIQVPTATRLAQGASTVHAHLIPVVPTELLNQPLALRANIGRAHDTVGTASRDAQAYYDQGLAYLHGYVWIEAARSFNQALRLDPKLAIAQTQLSIAYTELNQPSAAQMAIDRARALAAQATEHDRLHIAAREAQIAAESAPGDRAKLAAYRQALDAALAKASQDPELLILRGVAESPDPADRGQGSVAASIPFYEKAAALGSLAAHHYLTHALENTMRLADAQKHADAYARAAPAIPHALHMNGHVLRRLGRIDEAIGAFEAASRAEADYLRAENIPAEYDFLISRGRTDDALAAANVLKAHSVSLVRAVGRIEAGQARLAAGNLQAAAEESNAALTELRAAPGAQALVAPALQQLQGQYLLRAGQRDRAHAMLEDLVRKICALPGPDNWVQALFMMEAIARTARDAADWTFADSIARQMVDHDQSYAGGHFALALALQQRGDVSNARAEFALAARYWSRADPTLDELSRIRSAIPTFNPR